jgi:8-oxo-dGTP diphosphatase
MVPQKRIIPTNIASEKRHWEKRFKIAIKRMRGKLDYSPIAFALLPELFTLRQLQDVHEAILGLRLNKRRMLDRGWLKGTGEREAGTSFRPAELYRFKPID